MSIWSRLGLGVVLAIVGIASLQWWVNLDARARTESKTGKGEYRPSEEPLPDEAAGGRGVLKSLRDRARLIYLAQDEDSLPAAVAPILLIQPGGGIAIRRAPPLAQAPGPGQGTVAGVLLPCGRLSKLSAPERASLVRILTALSAGRGLVTEQVRCLGLEAEPPELRRILRWLR